MSKNPVLTEVTGVHHEASLALPAVIRELTAICGAEFVITDTARLESYGRDQTLDLHFSFDILVKPGTAEEIAAVLKLCNRYHIPVTPRGGGSGVSGGALPLKRGIVLSTERLNRIIRIDKTDACVIAEAGVITAHLCEQVEQEGLYFPVAPSSAAYSFIGGNVAENAGSIYSCKYGTTARYVLNLEVVLPSGSIIWTGANVTKNASGLNLTQLFVGSEGTLGIITKVVYQLVKKPAYSLSMLAGFENLESAFHAVKAIRESGSIPAAVELINHNAIALTAAYLNESLPLVKEQVKAHVLVHLEADSEVALTVAMETMASLLEPYSQENILIGTTAQEKERLWKLRYSIGAALTSGMKYRDIDIAIPFSGLYRYLQQVEAICSEHQVTVACFGHIMDGNLHTMLMMDEKVNFYEAENVRKAVNEIYTYAIQQGGVISGEHGIGLLQKELMEVQFSKAHLQVMNNIKQVFDPNGILNPGKIYHLQDNVLTNS